MGYFIPRTFPVILSDMLATLLDKTALTDLNFGSVFTTLLEAAAQEDDEQYFQMMSIIRGYQLDTTTDSDLDDRASEYGVTRLAAQAASTDVTFGDDSFTKISTSVFSGLPGAISGSQQINGEVSVAFSSSGGSIVIGRGTSRCETISYYSIIDNETYITFLLGTGAGARSSLLYDHAVNEEIVLSQGGDRAISAGTLVKVPSSDTLSEISFTLDEAAIIYDGEVESELSVVTASEAGIKGNVPIGAIRNFASSPFSGATVYNPTRVTNGSDDESDQQLRDRIRETVQSLSRGTPRAIISEILGTTYENKRVVSTTLRDATVPTDVVKVYIDDGTGFIPSYDHVGFEEVMASADGGEKYLTLRNTPIVKASVETQVEEPYDMSGGTTGGNLYIEVGGVPETISFGTGDFVSITAATVQEIITKINNASVLAEARATNDGATFRLFSRGTNNEEIQISSGSRNVNTYLRFPTDKKHTVKLYKKSGGILSLLNKDGSTATIEADLGPYYVANPSLLSLVVDGATDAIHNIWFNDGSLATVESFVDYINARASGFVAETSSGGTRLALSSTRSNSSDSKMHILDQFDYMENDGVPVTPGSTIAIFVANGDTLTLASTVPFNSIYFEKTSAGTPGADIYTGSTAAALRYSKTGGSWSSDIGMTDSTDGFRQSGHMLFNPASDWTSETANDGNSYYMVRIQRTEAGAISNPPSGFLRICDANQVFAFPGTEAVGTVKDYTLNRFLGQVQLEEALIRGDAVSVGLDNDTYDARAFVEKAISNGVSGLSGSTFTLVDSGVTGSFVFGTGVDSAVEVMDEINNNLSGVVASLDGSTVKIRTNRLDGGSIQIGSSGANAILQFPTDLVENFISHQPSIESTGATAAGFAFEQDDTLIIAIDDNDAIAVPAFYEATMQTGTTGGALMCPELSAIFPNDSDLTNFRFAVSSGSYEGITGSVSAYDATDGKITPQPGLGAISAVQATGAIESSGIADLVLTARGTGEYGIYDGSTGNNITIQVRAKSGGYETLTISNGTVTEVYATDIYTANGDGYTGATGSSVGTGNIKFAISRFSDLVTIISAADIYTNELTVGDYQLSGGRDAANAPSIGDKIQIMPLTTQNVVDFWNNDQISAETNLLNDQANIDILSNNSVQIASKSTGEDASVYVTGGGANSKLQFTTRKILGVDGYKHFTGLLREVQWKIDGKLDDQTNYPGIRAAGVQVEVLEPVIVPVILALTITSSVGSSVSILSNEIKSSISTHINKLSVGNDVTISDLIVVVKRVTGVSDVVITSLNGYETNLLISDNQLARVSSDNITISGD
jgi:uncharacterized phage protein gp47/JayE